MKVLILEAATEKCSVAVAEGQQLLSFVLAEESHQHASHLTVYIERALQQAGCSIADIDAVALGHGPGSFTGLRVGAAVAKGLCLARPQLKFLTVDSMQAMADRLATFVEERSADALFISTIDSRRGEVYCQLYGPNGEMITKIRSEVLADNPFPEITPGRQAFLCGAGVSKVAMLLEDSGQNITYFPDILADAKTLLPLVTPKVAAANFSDYASYEPLYLKPPFVTKSTKKLL